MLKSEKVYNFRLKFAKEHYEEGAQKTFLSFSHLTEIVGFLLTFLFSGGGGEDGILGQAFELY